MISYFNNNLCCVCKGIPKRKYVQVRNRFPTWKLWFRTSKTIDAKNPRGSQKYDPHALVYGSPIFAIPTLQEIRSGPKRIFVQVGNGFPAWKSRFCTSKTIYATHPRGSKKLNANAVVYGPVIFAIPTHERNTKRNKRKYVHVRNPFLTWKTWFRASITINAMHPRGSKK